MKSGDAAGFSGSDGESLDGESLKERLQGYGGFIFDLDGVLWQGERRIEGAAALINGLQEADIPFRFVSNTSSRSLQETLDKMRGFGFAVGSEQVFVASRECARQVAEAAGRGALIYAVGSPGLKQELELAGLEVLKIESSSASPDLETSRAELADCEYVVCGHDTGFSYERMRAALWAFIGGAGFAAVNLDATAPAAEGLIPAGGAIAGALEVLAGRPPDIMPGKPGPDLLERAARSAGLEPSQCLMVGDTPEADMAAARRAGMDSLLVFSGNTAPGDLREMEEEEKKPDFVLGSLADMHALILD